MSNETNLPKYRVLIADKLHQAGIDMLKTSFDVDVKTGLAPDKLKSIIENYHAVIVRSATKLREPILEHATNLKVIARAGAGLDNIDVSFAKEMGIEVVNAPNANSIAVAELALGLMLGLARHLPKADYTMKQGEWQKKALMGISLYGKTIGIVGFGKIGQEVARRAKAFGMNLLAYDVITPRSDIIKETGVTMVDFETLLKKSDFISLHVPALPETKGFISTDELAMMKPTAYLINTSRGVIIDEPALLKALNENQIAGAGLDVYAAEPAINNELALHPNVVASPHIAASTGQAQKLAAVTVVEQVIDILMAGPEENHLSLKVIQMEKIVPHEHTDPDRVKRLMKHLERDGVMINPPIVTEWEGVHVVLDGATRTATLKEMGIKYVVAQTINNLDDITLYAWNHVIQNLSADDVLALIDKIPSVNYREADLKLIHDAMVGRGGLCYLVLPDDVTYVITATPGHNRLDAINELVSAYIDAANVERIITDNFERAKLEYRNMTALFVFAPFTIKQVLQIASTGRIVPAGITRFVVPGRVLRMNIDLKRLNKPEPLPLKSAWLNKIIGKLVDNYRIRYYKEPVYMLDE